MQLFPWVNLLTATWIPSSEWAQTYKLASYILFDSVHPFSFIIVVLGFWRLCLFDGFWIYMFRFYMLQPSQLNIHASFICDLLYACYSFSLAGWWSLVCYPRTRRSKFSRRNRKRHSSRSSVHQWNLSRKPPLLPQLLCLQRRRRRLLLLSLHRERKLQAPKPNQNSQTNARRTMMNLKLNQMMTLLSPQETQRNRGHPRFFFISESWFFSNLIWRQRDAHFCIFSYFWAPFSN